MATQKFYLSLPYDNSTLANYLLWAQGIGTAMTTLGWTKVVGDTGTVNWANVIAPPVAASGGLVGTPAWSGAWVGGTSYAIGAIVTNGGLTYICNVATQVALTQVVVNLAKSESIQSVAAAAAAGTTVYTITSDAGAAGNAYVGFVFVVTGCTNPLNNGTFICTASVATTLTLSNAFGVVQAGAAGTATSSTANVGFISAALGANAASNAWTGLSMITTGFAASSGANNGTFTVTCSSTTCFGAAVGTCVNETYAGFTTSNTAPASDIGFSGVVTTLVNHWASYNYEIYQSAGPLSTTSPLFVKLVYGASNTTAQNGPGLYCTIGTGQTNSIPTGSIFNAGTEVALTSGLGTNNGGLLVECDFFGNADKFSMILWRGGTNPVVFCIDRAKDQSGNDLDTYSVVLIANGASGKSQVLFKPGAGTVVPAAPSTAWPCIFDSGVTSNVNGSVPAYLCFPMVGYMGNPLLGAVAMHSGDMAEGQLVNIIIYGANHTYLTTKTTLAYASSLVAGSAAAIQWEVV